MPIEMVPLDGIRENPVALRAVNKQAEDYLGLVSSIRTKGFLGSITGRRKTDEAEVAYIEITDGLHRYSASRDAGLKQIPVDVLKQSDAENLETQIMLNVHKVETKPVQYSQQLRRVLSMNALMTEAELAAKLGKSPAWIKERLGLVKLPEKIGQLIDDGKITLANAYALAKLPQEEMAAWVDRAMTQQPGEFIPNVSARSKEISDAKRQGKDAAPAEFVPVPHLQKLGDFKDELAKPAIGPTLVKTMGAKTPAEGFVLALKWALHLDDQSVAAAKSKYDEQQHARETVRAEKKAEREKAKADEAAKVAAEAMDVAKQLTGKK